MKEWGIENCGHRKNLVFLYVSLAGHEKVKWWNGRAQYENNVHKMRRWQGCAQYENNVNDDDMQGKSR